MAQGAATGDDSTLSSVLDTDEADTRDAGEALPSLRMIHDPSMSPVPGEDSALVKGDMDEEAGLRLSVWIGD